MRTTTISKGGQLSIPAEVRHRWGARRVAIEDRGAAIVVRPIPDDSLAAAIGSLRGGRTNSSRARAIGRAEESEADAAKWGHR
jgi:bifunctional DNA-binding transcriptional regulator/antitoxin component of YhaV-PrlF toxin-antitoxin module